jgi:hypothetical protein
VPAVGETFEGRKHGHRLPASLWSTENYCNWEQQAKSRRARQTRLKDNTQRNCSAAWSGASCGLKNKTVTIQHDNARPQTACLTLETIQKKNWELLSHPPYSPDLAPLRLPPVPALERSPESLTLWDWHGSQGNSAKLVVRRCNGFRLQKDFKILKRWQKCINQDRKLGKK